jgi:hypothetical protein
MCPKSPDMTDKLFFCSSLLSCYVPIGEQLVTFEGSMCLPCAGGIFRNLHGVEALFEGGVLGQKGTDFLALNSSKVRVDVGVSIVGV